MISNYFKVAWRNIRKNKIFSFINVISLAIGLTCCMLISLYLYHELSYDSYHANIRNLYQLETIFIRNGKEDKSANTPAPMAKIMQQEFPEIAGTTRLLRTFADDKTLLQHTDAAGNQKSFYESQGFLADSAFFRLLTYQFKEGNPATALAEPNTLVLSQEIAMKFFGNEPALNKVIHISSSTNGDHDFKVTGVFIPNKVPSHIDARFIMSLKGGDMEQYVRNRGTDLASNNMFYTYLLLKDGSDPKKLESKFPAFIDRFAGKDLRAMGVYKKQYLTNVKDVYLRSGIANNVTPGGSVTYLYILASIAVLTLLIACINFMNLSTARSAKRSAEVGVRKVLGAEKNALLRQFLGESIMMSLLAFIAAIVFTILLLPFFTDISGKDLTLVWRHHCPILAGFVLLAIVTGFVAGSYPAFYLSSFKPVNVLKGRFSNSLSAVVVRKGLVIFQFVTAAVLIVASVVIAKQMEFLRSKDLGFSKDQQVVIPLRSLTAKSLYPTLKNELNRNVHIQSVGASAYYPGIFNPSDMPLYRDGLSIDDSRRTYINYVDHNFLQTLGITPVAGRIFSPAYPSDTANRIVLNEEGIKQLGFASAQEAVNKFVAVDWKGETHRFEVIGVVKDFHFKDLHLPIEPYAFRLVSPEDFNYIIAHAKKGDITATLKSIGELWKKVNPNEPFSYSFLDQDFEKNYLAENRLARLITGFTAIAILISCLGLFGLATFSAEQRTKEIGIRKVLGASVASIAGLLSKDFLKLVSLSVVIASPLAWYVMNNWLQNFAYRIYISWQIFVITAVIALFIAIVTISLQAIRAAIANPVKSLRTE